MVVWSSLPDERTSDQRHSASKVFLEVGVLVYLGSMGELKVIKLDASEVCNTPEE